MRCFALLLLLSLPAQAAEVLLVQPHQGLPREVLLALPDNRPGPHPLILVLHGAGDAPASFRALLELDAPALAAGFAVAWPAGVNRRWHYAQPLLRGPAEPAIMPDGAPVDDLAFLAGLVDRLVAEGLANRQRIFLAGFSVGGLMAVTAGCAQPNRYAAIAVLGAGMLATQARDCAAGPGLPALFLSGDGDPVFPWAGVANDRGRMLSRPESMEVLARRNGCSPVGPEDASGDAHADCPTGLPVRLLRVAGAGHMPPEGTAATLLGFFAPLGAWRQGSM